MTQWIGPSGKSYDDRVGKAIFLSAVCHEVCMNLRGVFETKVAMFLPSFIGIRLLDT